jgi:hypothetical protein
MNIKLGNEIWTVTYMMKLMVMLVLLIVTCNHCEKSQFNVNIHVYFGECRVLNLWVNFDKAVVFTEQKLY